MKRFEKFNANFNENQSAEEQSLDMLLAHIIDTYGLEINDRDPLIKRYYAQLEWLNEEVE